MLITAKTTKKTGKPYWMFRPTQDSEKGFLERLVADGKVKKCFGREGDAGSCWSGILATKEMIASATFIEEREDDNHEQHENEGEDTMDYSTMGITELRTVAREKCKEAGHASSWIAVSNKPALLDYLNYGTLPGSGNNETPPATGTTPPASAPGAPDFGMFGAMFAEMLKPYMTMQIDEKKVVEIIKKHMDRAAKKVVVHLPDGTTKDVGLQHKLFPKLVTRISHRIHTMLVGPAGSGKTHAIHSAADSVGRKFYAISVGQQTTKSDLLGYKDANGVYQRTPLRDAVEFGGVFLLDEADAGNANTLTILNAMLSNGFAAFPDGMIDVHPDFVCFLAMNTYGRGADRSYVGRNQLDAASTDRFALIDFDYDEALEKAISRNDDWTAYVQKVRKAVFDQKIKHVVSPRASMMGGTLLEAGEKWKDVENEVLWKGLDSDLRQKALSAM